MSRHFCGVALTENIHEIVVTDFAWDYAGRRASPYSLPRIIPGIAALAATGLNVNFAISLHAPDDATRAQLLPVGRRFGV